VWWLGFLSFFGLVTKLLASQRRKFAILRVYFARMSQKGTVRTVFVVLSFLYRVVTRHPQVIRGLLLCILLFCTVRCDGMGSRSFVSVLWGRILQRQMKRRNMLSSFLSFGVGSLGLFLLSSSLRKRLPFHLFFDMGKRVRQTHGVSFSQRRNVLPDLCDG